MDEETKTRKRRRNKRKDEGREKTVSVNSICTPPQKNAHWVKDFHVRPEILREQMGRALQDRRKQGLSKKDSNSA